MPSDSDSALAPERAGALHGIRVIDFGHYIAGPLAGMLLADQGAEVIKVERPQGDPARAHPAFAIWNRGKPSVVIDLQSSEGQAQAQALMRSADVVIENFRLGVAARLGIGYEALAAQHPAVIYCSLPGCGPGHPLRQAPGWEPIIGASTGLYPPHPRAGRGSSASNGAAPWFTPLPIASTYAAMLGVACITLALGARDTTQRGQRIEIPLHSAMFTAMGRHLVKFETFQHPDTFAWPRQVVVHNVTIANFRHDPYVRQAGLIVTREHPARGNVDHLGTTAQLSGTPLRLGTPTPVPGGNTREILQELGYTTADIEQYIAQGVVRAV